MEHIVVIGSGAREISAVEAFLRSLLFKSMKKAVIDVLPGGGGFDWLALQGFPVISHPNIKATDIKGIVSFCMDNEIRFVFVGPEAPIDLGLVDLLEDLLLCVFGPRKAAAIEGSKALQHAYMEKANIPTSEYAVFDDYGLAVAYGEEYFRENSGPLFIKADGLCGGKGVEKCESAEKAIATPRRFMIEGIHGDAGRKVVIEHPLEGGNEEEVSLMVLCDGTGYHTTLVTTQDHKPLLDGNKGPNTGGVGAWGPVLWVDPDMEETERTIIEPMLNIIAQGGVPYKGCLYVGLMITPTGPKVVEFNERFGDPEGPVVFDLLSEEVDVLALLMACGKGKLAEFGPVPKRSGFTVCVVLCAQNYGYLDRNVVTGDEVTGVKEAEAMPGVHVVLSGVTLREGRIFTASGRAVYVLAHAETLGEAIEQANAAAKKVHFCEMHSRTDIGAAGLKALQEGGFEV